MDTNDDRSLIPVPDRPLASPPAAAERILSTMVGETLALVRDSTIERIDLDALVREAKRIQRREGMTAEDVKAFELFYQAATAGHPEAQYHMRDCYLHGFGVTESDVAALEWLRKAAESGHAAAQFTLGVTYENGVGVPLDDDEADRWFSLAATNGNVEAQCKVAEFYRDGLAGVRDYETAGHWYHKAAVQGNAEAQFELGLYFSGGKQERSFGSCPDRKFMEEYLDEQVAVTLANSFLGKKVPFGVLNARTGEEIIPADRMITMTLIRKLARERDELAPASSPIHACIRDSLIRFGRSAASWFRKAAEGGHADAQRNLARCYQFGDGIEVDNVQAVAWLNLAAVQKDDLARWMLDRCGFVITADKDAAETRKESNAIAAMLSSSQAVVAQKLYEDYKQRFSAKR